jgi:hypothetical protein
MAVVAQHLIQALRHLLAAVVVEVALIRVMVQEVRVTLHRLLHHKEIVVETELLELRVVVAEAVVQAHQVKPLHLEQGVLVALV